MLPRIVVQVSCSEFREKEVEREARRQLFRKGSDRHIYFDCAGREEADLLVVNLNLMDGVRARIFGDSEPLNFKRTDR